VNPYPARRVRFPAALITPPPSRRRGGYSPRRAAWEVTHPLGCLITLVFALVPIAAWLAWAAAVTAGWVLWTAGVSLWWACTLPFRRPR